MKKLAVVVLFLIASTLGAQGVKAPEYKPTEIQSLRLQVKQKDAQIAQRDLQSAQARFQEAFAALNNEAAEVKKENKWPDDVSFDPNTLNFTAPAPKPAAPKK